MAELIDDRRDVVRVQTVLLRSDPRGQRVAALPVASAARVPQFLEDVDDVDGDDAVGEVLGAEVLVDVAVEIGVVVGQQLDGPVRPPP